MRKSHLMGSVCAFLFSVISTSIHAVGIFYTDEAAFNNVTSGMSLSLEGFETLFTTASTVNFPELSITANNVSDLESQIGEVDTSHPATEGVRILQYSTLTQAGSITLNFSMPINAFSVDIIDPLDGAGIDAFLSLSNSNGDSQVLLTGSQPNNNIYFAGITDSTQEFNSVTIFSTKVPGDAISLDRLQFNTVPLPPALWLFGSGLLGLIGMTKRKS
jgi:hypothetical protein